MKKDAGLFFGAGVPQQIIDYIEEKIIELAKRKLSGSNEKTFNSDIHTRGHFNKEIM
mgnify:CR=1 FL=1